MATTKGQLREALQEGDHPEDLVCFYQDRSGERRWTSTTADPIIRCTFDELPEREFDEGYGGTEGEPLIAFSDRYVYIKVEYDGKEWVQAIPRHPESLGTEIPWPGGG